MAASGRHFTPSCTQYMVVEADVGPFSRRMDVVGDGGGAAQEAALPVKSRSCRIHDAICGMTARFRSAPFGCASLSFHHHDRQLQCVRLTLSEGLMAICIAFFKHFSFCAGVLFYTRALLEQNIFEVAIGN